MASLNNAIPARFDHGGVLKIGADQVLKIISGSLRITGGGESAVEIKDGPTLGYVLKGDEQPIDITLDVKFTQVSLGSGSTDLRSRFSPIWGTSGATFQSIVIDFADDPSGATGVRATFAKCFFPDGPPTIEVGAGDDGTDKMTLTIRDWETKPSVVSF